jgi:hypothetical protein
MRIAGRLQHWIVWIGLLAYLVISLCNAPGMVLCYEKDGRVTLETAINGVCRDSWEAQSPYTKQSILSLSCKRCTDVPVSIGSSESHAPKLQAYDGPHQDTAILEAPELATGYLATIPETLFPQPPPRAPARHRFLKTVVLVV